MPRTKKKSYRRLNREARERTAKRRKDPAYRKQEYEAKKHRRQTDSEFRQKESARNAYYNKYKRQKFRNAINSTRRQLALQLKRIREQSSIDRRNGVMNSYQRNRGLDFGNLICSVLNGKVKYTALHNCDILLECVTCRISFPRLEDYLKHSYECGRSTSVAESPESKPDLSNWNIASDRKQALATNAGETIKLEPGEQTVGPQWSLGNNVGSDEELYFNEIIQRIKQEPVESEEVREVTGLTEAERERLLSEMLLSIKREPIERVEEWEEIDQLIESSENGRTSIDYHMEEGDDVSIDESIGSQQENEQSAGVSKSDDDNDDDDDDKPVLANANNSSGNESDEDDESELEFLVNSFSEKKVTLENLRYCLLVFECRTCRESFTDLATYVKHHERCIRKPKTEK